MVLAAQVVDKGRHAFLDEWNAGFLLSWALVALVASLPLALGNALIAAFVKRKWWIATLVFLTCLGGFHFLREANEDAREPLPVSEYPPAGDVLAGPPPEGERPNLVLVTIDTLRWDHLGYAGYERPVSPHIDRLAERGTVFEHGVAQVPATQGSMASMMTGVYPHVLYHHHEETGRPGDSGGAFVSEGFHLLAERLADGGYATAGFVSNPYLKRTNGFAQGFEVYDQTSGLYDAHNARDASAFDLVRQATAWLRERADERPFFLWVHMLDPHHPYEPLEPGPWEDVEGSTFQRLADQYRAMSVAEQSQRLERLAAGEAEMEPGELEYLIGRYDAEILQADRALGQLLEALQREAGGLEKTLVVVTSDHGEEFLDHGGFLHSHTLYDELVRVPFVVAGPGFAAGATAPQARLLDVAPTFLHAAALPTVGLTGEPLQQADDEVEPALSFLSLVEVTSRTPETKYFTGYNTNDFMCPTGRPYADLHSLFRARYGKGRSKVKFKGRLFEIAGDPYETAPIRDPKRLLREQCRLSSVFSRHPRLSVPRGGESGLSEEDRRNLEALGYVDD